MAGAPQVPPGARLLAVADASTPLLLEGGGELSHVELAYETCGALNADGSNAVLICHALTGDSHAAAHPDNPEPGWWETLVGPGRAVDSGRWFVVTPNLLGSCYGSTGPAGDFEFPSLTVADQTAAILRLLDALGLDRLHAVLGGSVGGMHALELATSAPERVAHLAAIGTGPHLDAWGLAHTAIQRAALELGEAGLGLARQIAHLTYRSRESFERRFGREREPRSGSFQVERYLAHKRDAFVRRFDPASYALLTRAMERYDLGGGDAVAAFARARARVFVAGFESDLLYPVGQSVELAAAARTAGRDVQLHRFESPEGHDAFLLPHPELAAALAEFLEGVPRELRLHPALQDPNRDV